jgi:hypothetical protein
MLCVFVSLKTIVLRVFEITPPAARYTYKMSAMGWHPQVTKTKKSPRRKEFIMSSKDISSNGSRNNGLEAYGRSTAVAKKSTAMTERTDIRGRVAATVIYDDGDGSHGGNGGNGGNDSESNSDDNDCMAILLLLISGAAIAIGGAGYFMYWLF